jgi:hypothetical protein
MVGILDIHLGSYFRLFHNGIGWVYLENVIDPTNVMI